MGSALSIYTSSLPTLPSQSPSPINSPSSYHNNMSQFNLQAIIRQQQEQLAAIQVQIQTYYREEQEKER